MNDPRRGFFLLIDGLDGAGKGVLLRALLAAAKADGRKVFDLEAYWRAHAAHPPFSLVAQADFLFSCEPTYTPLGRHIRDELIREGARQPARRIAEAYALDRQLLYDQVLKPALSHGISVIQSRGVTSSIAYQPLDAAVKGEQLSLQDVLALPGNRQALAPDWIPDVIVIPRLSAAEAQRRLAAREKQDDAVFERAGFQRRLKERFESAWFRELFTARGVRLLTPDLSGPEEATRALAQRLYQELLQSSS